MYSSGLTGDFRIREQASSSRGDFGLEQRARMDRSSEAALGGWLDSDMRLKTRRTGDMSLEEEIQWYKRM